jgi:hypothetical protein
VDRLPVSVHRRLLERLRKRRVGVARPRDVLRGSTVLEREGSLGNHLTSVGANDVDTEKAVRLRVREHLDEALRVEVRLRARVGAEGERADLVLDVGRLEILLALANPRHLGVRVHDGRNSTVVDVAVALLDVLDGGDGLFLGLVRKHGSEGDVANAANVGQLGAVLGVDNDAAALIELEADVLEAKPLGVWPTANGYKYDLGIQLSQS